MPVLAALALGPCAILFWHITDGNVFGLAFFGWLMATWTAWITLAKGNGPLGRFIMLTYNLSVLYAYSLTQKEADDPDEGGDHPIITEIALHRVVAVLSGCIWGIIITRIVWPISARSRLKEALSSLWLRLALVWKRDPLSVMATSGRSTVYMTARERLLLERSLSRLESLRVAAGSEFELKSAFADIPYANILRATRSMVNAFDAMNLELLKNETATEGEMRLLKYTARERQQLSARISHLLIGKSADAQHVLRNANSPLVMASSMKLEYPLSDVLPSVDHARDRLLARIYHFSQGEESSAMVEEDRALLYAYSKLLPLTRGFLNWLIPLLNSLGDGSTVQGDHCDPAGHPRSIRRIERGRSAVCIAWTIENEPHIPKIQKFPKFLD
ncbi:hypothetical protein N7470_010422 [Penicillium chermesinum]|nr:hypothetical protein N7470_010422 [Penicillium chermesinum]